MGTISSWLNTESNIQLVVNLADLKEFALELMNSRPVEEPEEEVYLSCNDVVQLLGVSRVTLWRWNNVGYLKAIKLGNKTMYKRSEVQKVMEG